MLFFLPKMPDVDGKLQGGMVDAMRDEIRRRKPKHGRKAKRGQPLGGRGGRAYRAR